MATATGPDLCGSAGRAREVRRRDTCAALLPGAAGHQLRPPSAARGLATLLAPLAYLSANLARGPAAHLAKGPNPHDLVSVGYGRLRDDYRGVLSCADGTISVMVQDGHFTLGTGATNALVAFLAMLGVELIFTRGG